MKQVILIHLVVIMVLWSCKGKKDSVRYFIPGMYVRYSEHEFGKEFDTLDIKVQSYSGDSYTIIRRWRYERLGDDGKVHPEYKLSVTTAVYDYKHHILRELTYGKIYSFDLNAGCLFNGPQKFQKL